MIVRVPVSPSRFVQVFSTRVAEVIDEAVGIWPSAKSADFGTGYDVALVTNFLHHFDVPTCTRFLAKVHGALRSAGRVVVLEFVPNADRVSPPFPARFNLTMLAETPGGDAYTFAELRQQLEDAGFRNVSAHAVPTPQTVLLAQKWEGLI